MPTTHHPALSSFPASWQTGLADALNQGCHCLTLDKDALAQALDHALGEPGLSVLLRERCPTVFSAQPVFVAPAQMQQMAEVIHAIETVTALPAWQTRALAQAPESAREGLVGLHGVFAGYDFHLDGDRLSLIEVNTNAGGAMLNAVLARAQRACCPDMEHIVPTLDSVRAFEQAIVAMFHEEWRLAGRTTPLRTVAIVDTQPDQQYLYPEFLLFQRLFAQHGLRAHITDPQALRIEGGQLWLGDEVIDLVYNRLTDFYLVNPAHTALRTAWQHGAAVITPNPRAHALQADKRHLIAFSDPATLQTLGVAAELQATLLAHVPRTQWVDPAQAETLWAQRRTLFFKPMDGYGSKAAYRGDKITRRAWEEVIAGHHVAQALAPPGERQLAQDPAVRPMKFDLRVYAYGHRLLWVAARLYQGQTTNFRTPGGGFAPVYSAVDPTRLSRIPGASAPQLGALTPALPCAD
ncbi:hypothetical protein [Sphaerotilus sp.]|uniref:hypothetical protein n=1 Tax=Sphaerotilus sp. TaxID=2093942 RepID=UPI002ACF0832|nr:hypothetical protein [Sphaerotilus sp.]MDZ7855544.1 hypothetical protein [Sphaerotilus sp.]